MKIENFEKATELMKMRKHYLELLDGLSGNFMSITVYNNQRHVVNTDVKDNTRSSENLFINPATDYIENVRNIVKAKIINLEIEIEQL